MREAIADRIEARTPEPVDQEIATGLSVVFDVQPAQSFLLLDGDPLLDPAALRRIRVAVKQGDLLARPIAAPAQP